jgi:hypothetical protein
MQNFKQNALSFFFFIVFNLSNSTAQSSCSLPGGIVGQTDAVTWTDANLTLFAIGGNDNAQGYIESGFQKAALEKGKVLTYLNTTTDFVATGPGLIKTVNFANGTINYSANYVNTTFPAELRTTTSNEFISGTVANGVYIFPPRGGVVGNEYTIDINFTTPVTAFSFDLIDMFDIVNTTLIPTFKYSVIIDGNIVGYIQGPTISNDQTAPRTLFDGNGVALSNIVIGHTTEDTFAFLSDIPVSNVKIRHEFTEGLQDVGERDPHGLDNFVYSTTGPCALPINLINFKSQQVDKQINLSWKTSHERDFSHFEIEKSYDTNEFIKIDRINSSNSSVYNSTDYNPNIGPNYYRLKMIDLDGTSKYSNIISIDYDENSQFLQVENPALNGEISITTNFKNPVFKLTNSLGVNLAITKSKTNRGFKIKANNTTIGIYYLSVFDEGKKTTKKIFLN